MKPKYIQLPPLPLDLPTEVIKMIWLYTWLSGEEQEMIRDSIRENLKKENKNLDETDLSKILQDSDEEVNPDVKEFTDLAFTFVTSFLYYTDYDKIDEQTRSLYRQGISAFGGISPTYRIALEKDAPIIVWDFHSLLVMAQMCFSFMLTDKDSDMRLCKHCNKAFVASRKGNEFCSQRCKNQYNVYKSREKKKGNKSND